MSTCRRCGCSDENACLRPDGEACLWVEPDLCSFCAEALVTSGVAEQDVFPSMFDNLETIEQVGYQCDLALSPLELLSLIGTVDLALRHPAHSGPSRAIVERVRERLAERLLAALPEARPILEMGRNPRCDVPVLYGPAGEALR